MGSCSLSVLVALTIIAIGYSSLVAKCININGECTNIIENSEYECEGDEEAMAALMANEETIDIERIPGLGISFYHHNLNLQPLLGGPNVTRGLIIVPDDSIAPEAYAPYAISTARLGYYAMVVNKPTKEHVIGAIMQRPELTLWSLVGHGISGGTLATKIAISLYPKVKALLLLGASLPQDVDLRDTGMAIAVVYGDADEVVSSTDVQSSLSRMPGETSVFGPILGIGHYDLVYSTCNKNNLITSIVNRMIKPTITLWITLLPAISQFSMATKRGLSFGDNSRLEPGHNNSKPYPQPSDGSGSWLVSFTEVPQPNTLPERNWWIFRPYKNVGDGSSYTKDYTNINGGLIYCPGAYVDGRAYFPLAFHIASMGHLVVIVQRPNYLGDFLFGAINNIINSTNPILSLLNFKDLLFEDVNNIITSTNPILSVVDKEKWAIGGHSFGGILASVYAYFNPRKVHALVLHAGGVVFDFSASNLPILQVYGTLDDVGEGGSERYVDQNKDRVNPNFSRFIAIDGANHYQTGDYGYQHPDDIAIISDDEQQKAFARASVEFLDASFG